MSQTVLEECKTGHGAALRLGAIAGIGGFLVFLALGCLYADGEVGPGIIRFDIVLMASLPMIVPQVGLWKLGKRVGARLRRLPTVERIALTNQILQETRHSLYMDRELSGILADSLMELSPLESHAMPQHVTESLLRLARALSANPSSQRGHWRLYEALVYMFPNDTGDSLEAGCDKAGKQSITWQRYRSALVSNWEGLVAIGPLAMLFGIVLAWPGLKAIRSGGMGAVVEMAGRNGQFAQPAVAVAALGVIFALAGFVALISLLFVRVSDWPESR